MCGLAGGGGTVAVRCGAVVDIGGWNEQEKRREKRRSQEFLRMRIRMPPPAAGD